MRCPPVPGRYSSEAPIHLGGLETISKRSRTRGEIDERSGPLRESNCPPPLVRAVSDNFMVTPFVSFGIRCRAGAPSASPDRTVVDGYPLLCETTYLRASLERG
jgi:hypothetical protein